jgi:hypothetical protein
VEVSGEERALRDATANAIEGLIRAGQALARAVELLDAYARHEVTCVCTACGSGFGDPHGEACPVGDFIRGVEA